MAVCRANKRDGTPCTLPANGPDGYCWAHSPANADKRKQAASRAGRAKPVREVADLKQEVRDLIADVKAGDQDRNAVAVMLQGYRVLKDYLELERRIKTTDELESQIAELRERIEGER
jgi:phage I-like protein